MTYTETNENLRTLEKRRELILALEAKQIYNALKNSGKLASGDIGDTDLGTELSDQDISLKLAFMENRELADIDRALSRIKNGTYGICESCGQVIEAKRVAAIPEANLCLECQTDIKSQKVIRH